MTSLSLALLVACGDAGPPDEPAAEPSVVTGVVGTGDVDPLVRAIHHVFDAEVVDVWMNEAPEPFVVGFPLGASSAYLDFFPQGTYAMDLTFTGTQDVAAHFEGVEVVDGVTATMVAVGFSDPETQVTFGGDVAAVQSIVLDDDLSDPPAGMARIRVFNAVIGGLVFAPNGIDVSIDGTTVIEGLKYGDDATIDVALGSHDFEFFYGVPRNITIDVDEAAFGGAPLVGHLSLMPGDPTAGEDLLAFALLYYPFAQEPGVFGLEE